MNLQELHINLVTLKGFENLILPERLGKELCKKIRNCRLYSFEGAKSVLDISFLDKLVNLDTLALFSFDLNNNAPKLPKLSTLILSDCSNIGPLLSANRISLKRMVLSNVEGSPFAPSQGVNHTKIENSFNRFRALSASLSKKNDSTTFNNLEFLQISEMDEENPLTLTSIIKQCPKLKILITQYTDLTVSNTDMIDDKVTFLAIETKFVHKEREEVKIRAGIVKIKADQYMIKVLSNDQDMQKMEQKLNIFGWLEGKI